MPFETVKFNVASLRRGIDEATAGQRTSAQPLVLRDPALVGLTIRVQGKRASFYLKYGKIVKKLGDLGNPRTAEGSREPGLIYAVDVAKDLADTVRRMLDDGTDPSDYLKARSLGATHDEALGKAASILAASEGAWTWEELVRRFVADKISKPTITSRGKVRAPSRGSIRDVKAALEHPDLDHLKPLLLRDLRRDHIERIRDRWNSDGRESAQRKLCAYTKSALTWARTIEPRTPMVG